MFLANENFPLPSIVLLRNNGYDIRSIQETSPGIADEEVLRIARTNNLIILTFDKDYGELIFRFHSEDPLAVVFFREKGQTPLFAGEILLRILTMKSMNLTSAFTVIEANNVRQRNYQK